MPKIDLTDIASLTNEQSAVASINANYATIETESDSFLSRDGTSPNQMEADLDMNSNRILNLPAPVSDSEPARKAEVDAVTSDGIGVTTAGLLVNTTADTPVWLTREIEVGDGLTILNPAGVSGNPTIDFDIDGLTEDATPDTAADYIVTYDDSASAHKKVLLDNLGLGLEDDSVTFAKMQEITTDRLIGRDTAATGNPEEISVGGGLEFTGSAGIQRSALTGDVTATAGSNTTSITDGVVTNAKLADMAQNTIKGRVTASTGDPEDLTATQAKTVLGLATSTTDNAAVRFDGTNGSTQNSALIIADTTGSLSRSGNGGIPLQGTNTNDSASAGYVGEFVSSEVVQGSAVSLTTVTAADITSISLTAGDWDVEGTVAFSANAATQITLVQGWVSSTSATVPTAPNQGGHMNFAMATVSGPSLPFIVPTGSKRFSLSATTTIYLTARAAFTTNTLAAFGHIRARRVR